MKTIADLLNAHSGEEAWIFGKGPSLDSFDMRCAGPLRICINESLLCVPKPTYFFAHDEPPIQRVATHWPGACRAVLQPVRGACAVKCGIPDVAIYTYDKRERELEVLDWPAEKIAQKAMLLGMTGTAHSAIHFCRLLSVSSIVFVGMDGKGGYAHCIGLPAPLGGGRHDQIRCDTINVTERLAIAYRFIES